mgnify:CR=1 FL=1
MLNQLILFSESAAAAANGSDVTMNVGEQLILGGSVTVLGMVITFIGLILLIFMTWLYPKIAKALISWSADFKERRAARKAERQLARQQRKEQRKEAQKADSAAPVQAEQQAAATRDQMPADEHSPELVAAITAAIAACLGTSSNGIVIRSLHRAQSTTPVWGARSRVEQVNNGI